MSRLKRKQEHIISALRLAHNPVDSGFDDIAFVHNALPEIASSEISLAVELFGKRLHAPVIINAITGGGPISAEINEALAVSARETGLGMAVGSQTVALESPEYSESFKVVRRVYPDGLIMANVGANVPVMAARRAVDMVSADALQIHLNVPQETAMKEGETDFKGWLGNIAKIAREIDVPVVVKEVGFGLSREVVRRLHEAGIVNFDVGGRGGTNFIAIEGLRGQRRPKSFENWGISTAASVVEVFQSGLADVIIAAGGIINGLSAAKALALGAHAVGIAGICLKTLFEKKTAGLVSSLENIKSDLRQVMQMLGVRYPWELRTVPVVITGKTREWLVERGADTKEYACREYQP